MSKLLYNVGTFKGLLGTAIIYLAETEGGTQFLVHKAQVTVDGAPVEKFVYTARSAMQSYLLSGDGTISSSVDMTKLADAAPSGATDAEGFAIITNGAAAPRVFNSQAFYSIKGEGVADYSGDKGTPVTGNNGQTVVINSSAKDPKEIIAEVAAWAGKNWYIVLAVVFLLGELMGWWNILGLSGKKKVRRARR